MIESIEFTNYKALRKTTLPLSPFTLLLGPNGSGKSSVLQALQSIVALTSHESGRFQEPKGAWASILSVTAEDRTADAEIRLGIRIKKSVVITRFRWHSNDQVTREMRNENCTSMEMWNKSGMSVQEAEVLPVLQWLNRMRVYALDSSMIAQATPVTSEPLKRNGFGLAAVLDDIKDNQPERWRSLLGEMCEWLPEYDYILFDKPQVGQKSIILRTKKGGHRIPAREASQGTLVALALLSLAYMPNPPSLIGLEEIDRSLHPRLLRHLQDALYRLSYPESCGETRPPIQVIATTHSPYLLDLYRDHPEEVVLAEKEGLEVQMKRLTDIEHYKEILGDSPLREVWYSGVLGGVSVKP